MTTARPQRRTVLIVAALLWAAAFGVRLGYVVESEQLAAMRAPAPLLDISLGWEAARNIRHGTAPNFERMVSSAPLYPHWLAAAQAVLGESMFVHRVVGAFLGSLRFLAIFAVLLWLTESVVASAVMVIALAGLPSLIYADSVLLKSSFEISLLTLVALCCLAAARRPDRRLAVWGGLTGLLLALSFLNQLSTTLYLPAVVLFGLTNRAWSRRDRAAFLVPAIGVFLTAFVPYQIMQRSGDRDGSLPRSGFELRLGYNERAGGMYVAFPGVSPGPAGHTFGSRRLAEQEAGRPLTPTEADRHHLGRALGYVTGHPGTALRLAATKLAAFINDFEPRDVHYLPWLRQRSSVMTAMPFRFALLFILGVFGVVALWRNKARSELILLLGLFAAVLAANCLTFVSVRSRLPASVPLALLGGPGLLLLAHGARRLRAAIRERDARAIAQLAGGVVLGALAAWASLRQVASPEYVHQSIRRANQNASGSRGAEQVRARLAAPHLRGPLAALPDDALEERAMLLEYLLRYSESFQALQELVHRGRHKINIDRPYIRYLVWLGDYRLVRETLARLRTSHPDIHDEILRDEIGPMRAVTGIDGPTRER